MVVKMALRDDLMQKFGPILLEAIVIMAVQEANRVRSQIGMPTITKEQFFNEINNHLSTLEPYEWMEEA